MEQAELLREPEEGREETNHCALSVCFFDHLQETQRDSNFTQPYAVGIQSPRSVAEHLSIQYRHRRSSSVIVAQNSVVVGRFAYASLHSFDSTSWGRNLHFFEDPRSLTIDRRKTGSSILPVVRLGV